MDKVNYLYCVDLPSFILEIALNCVLGFSMFTMESSV